MKERPASEIEAELAPGCAVDSDWLTLVSKRNGTFTLGEDPRWHESLPPRRQLR